MSRPFPAVPDSGHILKLLLALAWHLKSGLQASTQADVKLLFERKKTLW
jgi:hypothetical protein